MSGVVRRLLFFLAVLAIPVWSSKGLDVRVPTTYGVDHNIRAPDFVAGVTQAATAFRFAASSLGEDATRAAFHVEKAMMTLLATGEKTGASVILGLEGAVAKLADVVTQSSSEAAQSVGTVLKALREDLHAAAGKGESAAVSTGQAIQRALTELRKCFEIVSDGNEQLIATIDRALQLLETQSTIWTRNFYTWCARVAEMVLVVPVAVLLWRVGRAPYIAILLVLVVAGLHILAALYPWVEYHSYELFLPIEALFVASAWCIKMYFGKRGGVRWLLPPTVAVLLLAVLAAHFPEPPPAIREHIARLAPRGQIVCPRQSMLLLSNETSADGKLSLKLMEDAASLLATLPAPVRIHAATGGIRGRKSTSMTILMRQLLPDAVRKACVVGFPVSRGVDSFTKGVWMWAIERSQLTPPGDGTLVLLDAEGLGDSNQDPWLNAQQFAFTALFSSSLGYHIEKKIDAPTLSALSVLATLAKLTSEAAAASTGFSLLPRTLNIIVADGMLYHGGVCQPTYEFSDKLEEHLRVSTGGGGNPVNEAANEARRFINELFKTRAMYAACDAADGKDKQWLLTDQMNVHPGLREGPFVDSMRNILANIYASAPVKMVGDKQIEKTQLVWLARTLVDVLNQAASMDVTSPAALHRFMCKEAQGRANVKLRDEVRFINGSLPKTDGALDAMLDGLRQLLQSHLSPLEADLSRTAYTDCVTEVREKIDDLSRQLREENHRRNHFEWRASAWDACSGKCPGTQSRRVFCWRGDQQVRPDSECLARLPHERIPAGTQPCNPPQLSFTWQTFEWGPCVDGCPGHQTRQVHCVNCLGHLASEGSCAQMPKPETQRECGEWRPYKWEFGPWSPCSTQACGQDATRTRLVTCHRCDRRPISPNGNPYEYCQPTERPPETESCRRECPQPPQPQDIIYIPVGSCLAAESSVWTSRGLLRAEEVVAGDRVLAMPDEGVLQFSEVYFSDTLAYEIPMLQLTASATGSTNITLAVSPLHLIVAGPRQLQLPAQTLQPGERLYAVSHSQLSEAVLVAVSRTSARPTTILTTSGTVVANGLLASSFMLHPTVDYVNSIDLQLAYRLGGPALVSARPFKAVVRAIDYITEDVFWPFLPDDDIWLRAVAALFVSCSFWAVFLSVVVCGVRLTSPLVLRGLQGKLN